MNYKDIPEGILLAAEKFPRRTAYEYMGSFITYNELAGRAAGLGAFLCRDSSPVLIYGHKSPDFIIAVTACLIAGRCFVPCDISIPPERVKKIGGLSGAGLVICTEKGLSADMNVPELSAAELHRLYGGKGISPLSEGDENAYIIFTSGSTGEPKGIPIRRESLMNFCGYAGRFLKSDVHTGHALFSFDLSVADIFPALTGGHTLIETDAPPEKDTGSFVCTPTFLRLCLLSGDFSREKFPSLETILCCGEALPRETAGKCFERFGDIRLINAYGPAECCCFVTAHTVTRDDLCGDIPIGDGNNACNVEVRKGEIFISGISVARGYLHPSEHSDCFRDNGYYTGDMGELRDGKLYFKGRKNGFVKYSGFRVELSEIEREILKINGISDCACVSLPDSFGQARCIKAYVVTSAPLSLKEIKDSLSLRLPHYMIPKLIEFVSAIPMTANGKIKV